MALSGSKTETLWLYVSVAGTLPQVVYSALQRRFSSTIPQFSSGGKLDRFLSFLGMPFKLIAFVLTVCCSPITLTLDWYARPVVKVKDEDRSAVPPGSSSGAGVKITLPVEDLAAQSEVVTRSRSHTTAAHRP